MKLLSSLPGAKGTKPVECVLPHDGGRYICWCFATGWESNADIRTSVFFFLFAAKVSAVLQNNFNAVAARVVLDGRASAMPSYNATYTIWSVVGSSKCEYFSLGA